MEIIALLAIIVFLFVVANKVKPTRPEPYRQQPEFYDQPEIHSEQKELLLDKNGLYRLKYKDADGNISERDIILKTAQGKHFKAYCTLREEMRNFRIDRTISLISLDSGEIVFEQDLD